MLGWSWLRSCKWGRIWSSSSIFPQLEQWKENARINDQLQCSDDWWYTYCVWGQTRRQMSLSRIRLRSLAWLLEPSVVVCCRNSWSSLWPHWCHGHLKHWAQVSCACNSWLHRSPWLLRACTTFCQCQVARKTADEACFWRRWICELSKSRLVVIGWHLLVWTISLCEMMSSRDDGLYFSTKGRLYSP